MKLPLFMIVATLAVALASAQPKARETNYVQGLIQKGGDAVDRGKLDSKGRGNKDSSEGRPSGRRLTRRPLLSTLALMASRPDVLLRGKDAAEIDLTMDTLASTKQQYYDLLAAFDDEDMNAPPGPPGGWPHMAAFSTTFEQQVEYNTLLEEEFYASAHDMYFQSYGGKDAQGIHLNHIAWPEGATISYYTGVTHFRHVNDRHLVTFLFSNGRHDGGSNTYLTIDTSMEGNPFEGAQESFIDADDVSTYTWVSAYTMEDRDGPVHHYALFSGGNAGKVIGPSIMYVFEENPDGSLNLPPRVEWVEDLDEIAGPARYCLLADLGDLYDEDGNQVSIRGLPDIVIAGASGLDVYSTLGMRQWVRTRSIPLDDDTAAFLGVEVLDNYLVITARTFWNNTGLEFDAPCLVYDYQNDEVVQRFAGNGQTISVAVLDNKSRVLIGAGGQSGQTGQPNLMFDVTYDEEVGRPRFLKRKRNSVRVSKANKRRKGGKAGKGHKPPARGTLSLELSETQLALGMPLNYTVYNRVDPTPVSTQEYYVVPLPGKTKSRQVSSFRIDDGSDYPDFDADLVLEVNSGQTCNIYYRTAADEHSSKVLPLPGSEGVLNDYAHIYARAGDTLLIGDQLYVILAMFRGNNTVYSFGTEFFSR